MSVKILSQKEYLLTKLADLLEKRAKNQEDSTAKRTVSTVGNIFLELVRIRMREIARESPAFSKPEELVDNAISTCLEDLSYRLDENGITIQQMFDVQQISETLKFPAQELTELSKKLARSKELHKAGKRRLLQPQPTQVTQLIEVIEVGLQGAIAGLLARPLGSQSQLDFDKLGNEYHRSGDWFPYEITKDDLLFVVDDDGSIFISTENFPATLFKVASEELESLAQRIYTT